MSKVTEWYPASVQPVREGEYETRNDWSSSPIKRKFESGRWWVFDSVAGLWVPSFFGTSWIHEWRGLAEKPA